uniref:EF-hand domain-containing protein n=1 Tax=Astatotilapia calliptera TaxID=8154 RepID=A0A3P8PUF5_ASTCA
MHLMGEIISPFSFPSRSANYHKIKKYNVIFEMFDEEGNGEVKTQELERMMSLTGINPTKSELIQMAKDVDKEDTLFNYESFLGLMVLYHERTKNQDSELRAAFRVFDKEGKKYIKYNTIEEMVQKAASGQKEKTHKFE